MKKYVLTTEVNERGLHRIVALRDIPRHSVKRGDLGGFVESEKSLSQDGDAWVGYDALVYNSAHVVDNACVSGHSEVYGYSCVGENAHVFGNAKVSGNAKIYGDAQVSGNAHVFGNAKVYGYARVSGNDFICKDIYAGTVFENNKTCGDFSTYRCCPFLEDTKPINKTLLQILALILTLNSEGKAKLHNLLHKIS